MKIDVGALVDEPSVSTDGYVEANFVDLVRAIFAKDDFINKTETQIDNLTFL